MENKVREHLEELFEDAPPGRRTMELKEEMSRNLMDKYFDLIDEGKSPETAYNIVVESIGDVGELIAELEESNMRDPVEERKQRQKSATLTSIAIALYILTPLPLIVTSFFRAEVIGLVFLFLLPAAATGLLIYNSMTTPKYMKEDETMVEEFKEWKSARKSKSSAAKAISSAVWSLTLSAYFIISFMYNNWHVSWVIFIIGAAVDNIIKAAGSLKDIDS